MFSKTILLKKHRKPPYTLGKAILLLVIITHLAGAQTQASQEEPDDNIEVIVKPSSHNITFDVEDTENYQLEYVSCKNVKTGEQTENQPNICENLEPCSAYLATLTLRTLSNESSSQSIEKTVETGTDYNEPTVTIVALENGINEINMTWAVTDKACIKSYEIEVKSADKRSTWKIVDDQTELNINDLDPCKEYQIQLNSTDINNKLISNITTTSSTVYAEPGKVTVSFEPYNAQMKVKWETPSNSTCIDYYYLKWFKEGCSNQDNSQLAESGSGREIEDAICEWSANLTDQNAKEYIISGLDGCEIYAFQMYINNKVIPKSDEATFTAPEQVPGIVTAQNPDISATDVVVKWSPPKTNSKCVQYYKLFLTGPLKRPQEEQNNYDTATEETYSFFEGLDPCGEYNFTIIAISLNGSEGEALNLTHTTMEAKPTSILNYNIVSEPFALIISWYKPAFADLCLNGYRISGWNAKQPSSSFDLTTPNTSVRIDGLNSCDSYTVQIIPTTNTMDGELERIETETSAIVANAPSNFQQLGYFPNKLEFNARNSDNNTCETIYARFFCELTKIEDIPYKIQTAEQYATPVGGGFTALLAPLSPYTEYKCIVSLFNVAGWSPNKPLITRTEPYFPEPPEHVNIRASTNVSLVFNWKEPQNPNGKIKLYISYFQRVSAAYYVPPACSSLDNEPIPRETANFELSFQNLQPYTTYTIQLASQNEYGIGEYTRPYMVKTEPWISDPVVNLKVIPEGPFQSNTEYKANVVVSWSAPCKSNGEIECFILEFTGERSDYDKENFQRSIMPIFDVNGGISYNETNLKPQYNYTVTVTVKTKSAIDLISSAVHGVFDAPAGIPKRLNESDIANAQVDAYAAKNPTNSAVVRIPADILESEEGTIVYVALLLSEKNCNPEPQLRYEALDPNRVWPETSSWSVVYKNSDCIHQYQTNPKHWKPTPVLAKSGNEQIEYTIGTQHCDSNTDDYCNGPLKADTEYHLVIRLFTKSGYNDAAMLEFKTEALIQIAVILVSVASCLLLALIAGIVYLYVTKRIMWHRESCHGVEDFFGDIISKNFAIYYRDISKPEKMSREFKELTVVALDLSYSASELGSNKNRYADIFPYDKNRVILDIDNVGSDYINASFIDGYRRKKEYIATQGPKPETTMDFWRMVLQHNVRVIVMVTQFREGDTVKCHEYFPFKSQGINVTVKNKDFFEVYDRTEMIITHDVYGLKRKVTHLYFKKWPDHGCPTDPMNLITFVRKVKAEKVPSYSPIVVHCSAGVGRTGTFIGLDIIMQRLRSESKINVYETVKKLRFQRMKMVQTLTQYTFLYTCAYELVKHKNKNSALKYQIKNNKKVSFEDDAELTIGTVPTKFHGRRTGSDLSSVGEQEETDKRNGLVKPTTETNGYGTIPIMFNGILKGSDLESLDEQTVDAAFKEYSTESAM